MIPRTNDGHGCTRLPKSQLSRPFLGIGSSEMRRLECGLTVVLFVGLSVGCSVSAHKLVTGELSAAEQEEFDKHIRRGLSFAELNQYAKADEEFDLALKVDSSSFEGWFCKGKNLVHKGDYSRALRALDKAVRLDRDSAGAYLWRGACHLALGRLERAKDDLEQSLSLSPAVADRIDALFYLAKTHGEMGDYGQARRNIRQALELDPGNETLTKYLEALERMSPS